MSILSTYSTNFEKKTSKIYPFQIMQKDFEENFKIFKFLKSSRIW